MFPSPFGSSTSIQPLGNYNFVVFLDLARIPFSKITRLETSIETEALVEGGRNKYVHSLRIPKQKENILIMERGVVDVSSSANIARFGSIKVGNRYKAILIGVRDSGKTLKKIYSVERALLTKRSFSDLDANDGKLFVETMEFVYQEMREIPALLLKGLNSFD